MPKFSIIVPLYNVEKYISECIESVLKQTYTDFELLLVDDKSEDKSLEIAYKYAHKDSRVVVIEKEHGGLPHTRNYGLSAAKGEYIVLLDGDDYFALDHLERTVKVLDKYHCDMCIANNHINFTQFGQEKITLFDYNDSLNELNLTNSLEVIFNINNRLPAAAVLTVYKKNFIFENHIKYEESYTCSEDLDIFLCAISHVKNIKFIGHDFYYYRQDNMSAMTKNMTGNMYLSRMIIYKKWYDYYRNRLIEYFDCNNITKVLQKDFIANIKGIVALPNTDVERKDNINLLIENSYIWTKHLAEAKIFLLSIRECVRKVYKRFS